MSFISSERYGSGSVWLKHAIFSLDRWLRQREGVYEYSDNPHCLFRIQLYQATQGLRFSDGTEVKPGDRMLKLHIWNEQLPPMEAQGPTVAWARQIGHGIDASLRELAHYVQRPELSDITGICADMRLRTYDHTDRLARLSGLYGFEERTDSELSRSAMLHRLGENILGLLLVLAVNPTAARLASLWCATTVICMSRNTLEQRYLIHSNRTGLKPRREAHAVR